MPKRILVTGGTGTLGRPLVRRLLTDGHDVRVLSRRQRPLDAPDCAQLLRGDRAATRRVLAGAEQAGVAHLVYVSIVGVDNLPPLRPTYTSERTRQRRTRAVHCPACQPVPQSGATPVHRTAPTARAARAARPGSRPYRPRLPRRRTPGTRARRRPGQLRRIPRTQPVPRVGVFFSQESALVDDQRKAPVAPGFTGSCTFSTNRHGCHTLSHVAERIEWDSEAAEHIRTRSARYAGAVDIEPAWTAEVFADPDRLVDEPDPRSAHANSVRAVGYSPTAQQVITVVALRDARGVLHGVSAWKTRGTALRQYLKGRSDD